MIKVLLKQPAHSTLDANVLLVHHSLYLKEKKDAERIKYVLSQREKLVKFKA